MKRLGLMLTAMMLSVCVLAAGSMDVLEPWAKPGADKQAQVFLTLRNHGAEQDRLIGASSPLATSVQLRAVVQLGSVQSVQPLKSIGVPASGQQALAPGHTHLLLLGVKRALVAGEEVPLSLQFEKAGKLQVQAEVRP